VADVGVLSQEFRQMVDRIRTMSDRLQAAM
jgi:hypothetical protein